MPAYSIRLRLLVSALLTLLVVIAATALARQVTSAEPAVTLNLPRTGQTVCYDAGGTAVSCGGTRQDGDVLAGVAWPAPRFHDNGDQTITDRMTGLTWSRNAESPGINAYTCAGTSINMMWGQALDHVACLNSRSFLGFDDWRLPNVVELESLTNSGPTASDDWLESQGFLNVWGAYWSSTTYTGPDAGNGDYAFSANLLNNEFGITFKNASSYKPALWPVRGTTTGVTPLWKTGQTQSYAAGDDGAVRGGRAWPSARFAVQGECVTDRLTGLVWPRNADLPGGLRNWQQALDFAGGLSLCGFDDWRLPNRKELWSLVNFGASGAPGKWLLDQGFANVRYQPVGNGYYGYWSSTSYVYNPAAAFSLRLDSGLLGADMKGGLFVDGFVWPVRSGSLGPNPLPTDTPTPTPTLPPTPTATPTPIRPVVEDVTPGEVKAGVPGSLQIAGRNYQPGAAARLGGGLPLSTTYASAELLLAHVPAMGAGQYDVGVVNPDGYAGVKGAAYRVVGPAVTDLYGFDYELKPARQLEAVGEGTYLYFVVHRLGGSASLADVRVAFYLGDPADGGQLLGEGKIASLAPNGFFGTYVAWTPTAVGTHEIYAVIDPANQVAEDNEANNTYRSWAEARTAAPQDKTPPVVDRATAGLSQYTTDIGVAVTAHDPAPGSGVAWSYFLMWEFVPSVNDWLVMEESGWLPYRSSDRVPIWDWPGPRFLEVYVADSAENVSDPSGWAFFNYIPPADFLLTGESRWYLYPLLAGDRLDAQLRVTWPDADLYLWSEDGARLAVSATDGTATERVGYTAPLDGWYWLEVFAYADYPSFFLSASVAPGTVGAVTDAAVPAAHPLRTAPPFDLAAVPPTPSRTFRLPAIGDSKLYLPAIQR